MSDADLVDETLFEQWMEARERNAEEFRRAQAAAEERRQLGRAARTGAEHLLHAASHRSMAALYQNFADDEPDPQLRAVHQQNADTFARKAQEAEAQAGRLRPARQESALVSNSVENAL